MRVRNPSFWMFVLALFQNCVSFFKVNSEGQGSALWFDARKPALITASDLAQAISLIATISFPQEVAVQRGMSRVMRGQRSYRPGRIKAMKSWRNTDSGGRPQSSEKVAERVV